MITCINKHKTTNTFKYTLSQTLLTNILQYMHIIKYIIYTYIISICISLVTWYQGVRITSIKIDPYLNIDAGTLSPLDHGIPIIQLHSTRYHIIITQTWIQQIMNWFQYHTYSSFLILLGEVFVLDDGGEVDLGKWSTLKTNQSHSFLLFCK